MVIASSPNLGLLHRLVIFCWCVRALIGLFEIGQDSLIGCKSADERYRYQFKLYSQPNYDFKVTEWITWYHAYLSTSLNTDLTNTCKKLLHPWHHLLCVCGIGGTDGIKLSVFR